MILLDVAPIEENPTPADYVSVNWNMKFNMSSVGNTSNEARLFRFYSTKYTLPGMEIFIRGMHRRI
jgi:hypothetical protein